MNKLQEFKDQYPEYAGVPDMVLADRLYQKFYAGTMDRERFNKELGVSRGGWLDDVGRSVARGASFGFADEIAAAGDATFGPMLGLYDDQSPEAQETWRKRYDTSLQAQRAKDRAFDDESPVTSTVAKVGGGIASSVALLPRLIATAPATLPAAMKQGALAGGGLGAVTGFGEGEGGLGERATSAVQSGVIGAVAGGTIPVLAHGVGRLYSYARNLLGGQNPQRVAAQKIIQAFERDEIPLDKAMAELDRLAASGKPAALMDVGGENVLGLTRAAAGTPGPAKNRAVELLAARQGNLETSLATGNPVTGQASRVMTDAERSLGQRSGLFGQTFDDLLETARKTARPLYEKLYGTNGGVVVSDQLDDLARNPVIREALRKGLRIAQAEGDDLMGLGITGFNEAGDPIIGKTLSIKGFDYAKRGLDDLIAAAKRSGENETTRALMALKTRLTGEIDSLTGGLYGQARAAYAGPMAMRDAMEAGRNVLREEGGYEIAKVVSRYGPSEKQAYLQGVLEAIRDRAMNAPDGADVVKRVLGSPALREKIKAAFPDEMAYAKFAKALNDEARLFRNAQTVNPRAGSQTDLRAAERSDLGAGMLGDMTQAAITGRNLFDTLMAGLRASANRAGGMNQPTAGSLTDALLNPNYYLTRRYLESLAKNGPPPGWLYERGAEFMTRPGITGAAAGGLLAEDW